MLRARLPEQVLSGLEGRTVAAFAQVSICQEAGCVSLHCHTCATHCDSWPALAHAPRVHVAHASIPPGLAPMQHYRIRLPSLSPFQPPPAAPALCVQSLERGAEVICLFSAFKGVRAGKTLMQARRALKRRAAEKEAEKKKD